MPPIFDRYTLQTARMIVQSRADDQAEINLKYLAGDHWQDSNGYVGPRPQVGDNTFSPVMAAIRDAFVSRGATREITERHVNGVLGHELQWGFTLKRPMGKTTTTDPVTGQTKQEDAQPTDQEDALIDEAETALTEWWDKCQVPKKLKDALAAALNTKRGVLRLYVPPGMRDANGNIPSGDLPEVLEYLWPQHLGTNEDTQELQFPSATVYCDKLSRRNVGLFTYNSIVEFSPTVLPGSAIGPEHAELTYLDDAGNTVLRVIDNVGDVDDPQVMPLDGHLLMHEMNRHLLITPQMISQQKSLNMSMTSKQRNAVMGGFLERILLNVKLPGTTNADGTFTPTPLQTGAGTLNSFQGETYTDRDGNVHVLNPSVVYRDPISPDTFIASEESSYLAMLQEGNQLHYALAGDAVVSAVSRVQARDAFKADLLNSAAEVEAAGRWLLETALAMAAFLAGTPGKFDGLRAYVQARVDSGPLTPADLQAAALMGDKGIWSMETVRSATGVEDVDAEEDRVEKEKEKQQQGDAAHLALAQQLMDKARGAQPANGQTPMNGQQPPQNGQPMMQNGQQPFGQNGTGTNPQQVGA